MKIAIIEVVFADKIYNENDEPKLSNVLSRRVQITETDTVSRTVLKKHLLAQTKKAIELIFKQMEVQ